jgi:hypothetical protein
MRWKLWACVIAATLPIMATAEPPAHAGDGDIAAGVIGGLAAGALLGSTLGAPRHYGPSPVYVAPDYYSSPSVYPAPVYSPDCYCTRSEPYWDDDREVWIYPRTRVCE